MSSIFKKNKQPDPFKELLDNEEDKHGTTELFVKKVTNHRKASEDDGTQGNVEGGGEYVSPFRDDKAVAEAERIRDLKFPTTGHHSTVRVKDNVKRKAQDIAEPRSFGTTDLKQQKQLDELGMKENQLEYLRNSQKIVDVRKSSVGKGSEVGSVGEEATSALSGEGAMPVSAASDGKSFASDMKADKKSDVKSDVKSDIRSAGNLEEGSAVGQDTRELASGTALDERSEISEAPTKVSGLKSAVSDGGQTASSVAGEAGGASVAEVKSGVSEGKAGVVNAGNAAAVASDVPPTKQKGHRGPFKFSKKGIFALWKRSEKPEKLNATPEDPEFIVLTEKGYMSKNIYDRLEYEEELHQEKLASLDQNSAAKYEDTARAYEEKLASLNNEIAEVHAAMDQLKSQTENEMKAIEASLSQNLMDIQAKHDEQKETLLKEAENEKNAKITEKNTINEKLTQVEPELEALKRLELERKVELQQYQSEVQALTAELDARLGELQNVSDEQTEVNLSMAALEERRVQIEKDISESNAVVANNKELLQNLENHPSIAALDNQVSEVTRTVSAVEQEHAAQKDELTELSTKKEPTLSAVNPPKMVEEIDVQEISELPDDVIVPEELDRLLHSSKQKPLGNPFTSHDGDSLDFTHVPASAKADNGEVKISLDPNAESKKPVNLSSLSSRPRNPPSIATTSPGTAKGNSEYEYETIEEVVIVEGDGTRSDSSRLIAVPLEQ
ncbi:uncharacterized protein Ecym_1237 [Eremothecium cymbalariae DBVPG|uniref:Uncharacterized protein n=1 Tax=Eremothecium cymbalariae (strain CBS 270.75 / DBVPG 7215 / KCTC 17166 / NRRL Y-17582) TaxID=931890 RepID=G8JN19_ERECY|nr:hypothetical protein Ecym_1237 [Eremothecium cymbalariae DBVPG\